LVTRTRSENNLVRSSAIGSNTQCPPGTNSTSTRLSPHSGVAKVMTDEVVPGFKKNSSQGAVYCNPMNSEKRTCSFSGSTTWTITKKTACTPGAAGTLTETYPYYMTAVHNVQPSTYVARIDASSAITSAITEAYAGVAEPDLQGLVSLAELKKTIAMLRRPFMGLRNYLDQFRPDWSGGSSNKRKKRSPKAQAEAVAQQWLEYRYGIIPLMMDIEGVLKALRPRTNKRFTSRAQRVLPTFTTTIDTPASSFYLHDLRTKITEDVTIRAGVYYEHFGTMDERFGMSISDIPSAMWELIPYSFVVDWFLNIGSYIDAMTPRAGSRDLAAWYTVKRIHKIERSMINFRLPSSMSDYNLTTSPSGSDLVVFETTTRTPVTRDAIGLSATYNLSNVHVADAIALAIGALSGATHRATHRT
jgi:hypothetical protein